MRLDCVSKRSRPTSEVIMADRPTAMSPDAICSAPWTTLVNVPVALVEQWVTLFLDELRSFVAMPSELTLARLFMASKVILARPFHGGRSKATAVERIVARRLDRWSAGQIQQLWEDLSKAWATRRQSKKAVGRGTGIEQERDFRKVVALVNQGLPGKACRLLCSRGLATGPDVGDKMRLLFPDVRSGIEVRAEPGVEVDAKAMLKVLKSMPRGLAPGPSGLRADHLLQVNHRKSRKLFEEIAAVMAQVAQRAISGSLPAQLAWWFCGGRGVPLKKKDDGIRPLVVGEVLRAAVSRLLLSRCTEAAREALPAVQLGFSPGSNGLQAAVRTARYWYQHLQRKAILKVDISNAFNTVSRVGCCEGAENVDSELAAWVK